jgi:hypothetical protein
VTLLRPPSILPTKPPGVTPGERRLTYEQLLNRPGTAGSTGSTAVFPPSAIEGQKTTTRKFLRSQGTGTVAGVPTWDTILAADVTPGSFPVGAYTFQGPLTTTATGALLTRSGATTSSAYLDLRNTGGRAVLGVDASPSFLIAGGFAYDTVVRGDSGISFSANGGANLHARLLTGGGFVLTSGGVTLDNGQFYIAKRNSGLVPIPILGFKSATDLVVVGHEGSLPDVEIAANNTVIGAPGAIATTATGGFAYMPSCAGTPTGVPSASYTGRVPWVFDSTNKKICIYAAGAWFKTAALT